VITVSALYRHPIKSHGREELRIVYLTEGQAMPFDRLWAVAHDHARIDGHEWASFQNFSIGAKAPQLMAINATLDEVSQTVTLTHPDRPDLVVNPDRDGAALIDWVKPLVPQNRAQPAKVFRLDRRGFTDTDFASVSLCNAASHAAVEGLAQTSLSRLRWRGNIWFEGAKPWTEFDWVNRELRLGDATLRIEARIERCLATSANPATGARDVDTLRLLNTLGHQDFGIYARVMKSGTVKVGDSLEVI